MKIEFLNYTLSCRMKKTHCVITVMNNTTKKKVRFLYYAEIESETHALEIWDKLLFAASLVSYDDTFENFCKETGYEPTKDTKYVYKEHKKIYKKIKRITKGIDFADVINSFEEYLYPELF